MTPYGNVNWVKYRNTGGHSLIQEIVGSKYHRGSSKIPIGFIKVTDQSKVTKIAFLFLLIQFSQTIRLKRLSMTSQLNAPTPTTKSAIKPMSQTTRLWHRTSVKPTSRKTAKSHSKQLWVAKKQCFDVNYIDHPN